LVSTAQGRETKRLQHSRDAGAALVALYAGMTVGETSRPALAAMI
jgi:hypothetical protein